MQSYHFVDSKPLSLKIIFNILEKQLKLKLSESSIEKINLCRHYLDQKIKSKHQPIYGINTGFGSLCNVEISKEHLEKLQNNLVMSHACGVGDQVPKKIVKLMLLLKIQALSLGYSGVQLKTVKRLIEFYNHDIIPVVYKYGSLGASGDLAPLAHLALPLLGKGEVLYNNKNINVNKLYKEFGWKPIKLQSKEGLALLNGTQLMSAYGVFLLIESFKTSYLADLIGSISIEAFNCRIEPFNLLLHHIRPHNGQIKTAENILGFLKGSKTTSTHKPQVQDPYSFRCIPQVHGASKDTLAFVEKTIITEINSVTDNPNIFIKEDQIISGGNFHGQPLALALDYLKIAMAELGNISERRTYKLVSGSRDLPEFLVKQPGLNSGFMIPQYTAASLVSANKQLATPASIDSIVSSNGQEDHVSMGANAATQAYDLVKNLKSILAIELLTATQATDFRKPLQLSSYLTSIIKEFRQNIPFVESDVFLHPYIKKSEFFLENILSGNDIFLD